MTLLVVAAGPLPGNFEKWWHLALTVRNLLLLGFSFAQSQAVFVHSEPFADP